MADENEQNGTAAGPEAADPAAGAAHNDSGDDQGRTEEGTTLPPHEQHFAAYPPGFIVRGSSETGEGSLLERTVELVDKRSKASIDSFLSKNAIEMAPLAYAPDGEVSVLEPNMFDSYRSKPLYREGTAQLGSVASLIDYTSRYKGSGTVLFADDERSAPSITAVFDYHEEGGPEDGGQRFGRHRATHALPLSDEWKAWKSLDGKPIEMKNFARFLEDHIVDVLGVGEISPSAAQQKFIDALGGVSMIADPARLMELATGLRIFENSQASQVVNLSSGEGEVVFTSAHTDQQGGKLNIPRLFVLAIPVFQNGDPYQIVTRLRYRKDGGGIFFFYELWRDDLVFDHAFEEAAHKAASGTSVPLFLGKPSTAL